MVSLSPELLMALVPYRRTLSQYLSVSLNTGGKIHQIRQINISANLKGEVALSGRNIRSSLVHG